MAKRLSSRYVLPPAPQITMQQYSSYFQELDDTAKQRYRKKMNNIGVSLDPYLLQESGAGACVEWQNWPRVKYPDVYNYLIKTPSQYTGESLKAYKSRYKVEDCH